MWKVHQILFLYCLLLANNHVTGTAIMGYEYAQEADAWLRLHTVPAVWRDAHLRCHLEGGMLASPTSSALTNAMVAMMAAHQLSLRRVFTGIQAVVAKGHFMTLGEYQLEPRTGSCYKFHDIPRTWHQAAAACFSEGGRLAIINSDVESQVLKDLFEKHPENTLRVKYPHVAMIGFWDWNEHSRNEEWLTIFGETLPAAGFETWSPNEPNNAYGIEFCGSIARDGLLNDFQCNRTAVFICEITLT